MKIQKSEKGFSLVEVMLALGVASFCLLTMVGLLLVGIQSNLNTVRQSAAAGVTRAILADLRATPKTSASQDAVSPTYKIPIPKDGSVTYTIFLKDDGSPAGEVDQNANAAQNPRSRATLVFTVPPAKTMYYGSASEEMTQGKSTLVRVLVTWPALVDKSSDSAPTYFNGSYETLSALDRN